MDFVISLGLLECHAPPRRTQQKSTATPAAHPLGKHANLGPPQLAHSERLQAECHADRSTRLCAKPREMYHLRDLRSIAPRQSLADAEAQRTR
jgi:hypothetical protein